MVIYAIAALILGIFIGVSGLEFSFISFLTEHSDYILYLLMFLVGISVGMHQGILAKIRQYHIKILILPAGIIIASLAGGFLCSLITGYSLHESAAIASGLGWYSLSGITITTYSGAQLGSIAFLSNLMREIFSFFSIPFLSKRLNYFSCIASAGATSEDTTLPMMIKYTNGETVVLSVLNGILCSAAVPVLIALCYSLAQ